MTFAERLKQLRHEKGMSLENVADAIGISKVTVHRYETGEIANVPLKKVHELANLFHVTRPYIMGWTDDRNVNPHENLDVVAEKLYKHTESHMLGVAPYWKTKEMSESDCITAASQAMRALIKFNVARTPIYPHQIIQDSDRVTMVSFEEPDEITNISMNTKLEAFGSPNDIVVSYVYENEQNAHEYLFCANRSYPIGDMRLALAVELGHAYLGHPKTMVDTYKYEKEAECFALHLEFPRPVIRLLQERGYVINKRRFERVFGTCDWCVETIRHAIPVHVPPELNRIVKEQFTPYINKLEKIGLLSMPVWSTEELDLSKYMAGYED